MWIGYRFYRHTCQQLHPGSLPPPHRHVSRQSNPQQQHCPWKLREKGGHRLRHHQRVMLHVGGVIARLYPCSERGLSFNFIPVGSFHHQLHIIIVMYCHFSPNQIGIIFLTRLFYICPFKATCILVNPHTHTHTDVVVKNN